MTAPRLPPEVSAWEDTEPTHEREVRERAWQDFRSCRDCRHWQFSDEFDSEPGEPCVGSCGQSQWHRVPAAFLVPEDYTCGDFEPKEAG